MSADGRACALVHALDTLAVLIMTSFLWSFLHTDADDQSVIDERYQGCDGRHAQPAVAIESAAMIVTLITVGKAP